MGNCFYMLVPGFEVRPSREAIVSCRQVVFNQATDSVRHYRAVDALKRSWVFALTRGPKAVKTLYFR